MYLAPAASSLVTYSDSDDDNDNDEGASTTDTHHKPVAINEMSSSIRVSPQLESLPQPDTRQLIGESEDIPDERIRVFAHERGNWASYAYIPVLHEDEFACLSRKLSQVLNESGVFAYKFFPIDEYHISLSRTLKLKHHWIEDIRRSITWKVHFHKRFFASMCSLKYYTNDDKTRSFVSLEVAGGSEKLQAITSDIDSVIAQYGLPSFYEDPSYHVSLCWCLYDASPRFNSSILDRLQKHVDDFLEENRECSVFTVDQLILKTGDKEYQLPLSV